MAHLARIAGGAALAVLTIFIANGVFDQKWGGVALVLLWIGWTIVLYIGKPALEFVAELFD